MRDMKAFEWSLQWIKNPLMLQLFCLAMAFLIVWQIWSGAIFMSELSTKIQQKTSISTAPRIENLNRLSLRSVAPLFGDYVPQNLDAAGVSQSMLNFTVVGIVFASNENDSQVILQSPNGQEQFYRVGDRLPGGVEIKRITMEGVLVLREGHLERLSMQKDQLHFNESVKALNLDDSNQ